MSIFDKRASFKPFEYPEVLEYKSAINHSYWLVSEWNFISDIHDFSVNLNELEKNAIKNTLLAISQIEVSVKRFWTKLGERFPKSEFEQVGVTFGECFIDETEILTPSGWVDLQKIAVGDEVIQFHADNTIDVTKVRHKTDERYDGKMYKFFKNTTAVVVTPNHRMVCYNHDGDYQEITAEKFSTSNSDLKIPEVARLVGGKESELSFKDKLRIAVQADGKCRHSCDGRKKCNIYDIRFKKDKKIKRLDWILQNVNGVEFSKKEMSSGIFNYTIRIDDDYDYKNFDWVSLKDKNNIWCLAFIEELTEWNGHGNKIRFSSTNKKVADVVQMVGVGAGYRTNMLVRIDDRKDYFKNLYIVSFTGNREGVTLPPLKSEIFDYLGMVRCVTVESGAVVTRYKGKTFISGNSEVRHADAYSHLLQVLGLNDDFTSLLENPVIQGRVDYLTKYLRGAADNNNENYTLTLTLFSIFIENVSLFSQFAIIKSFNKYRNLLKDIDNVVQATQKEELIHAMLGVYLIKQIQREYPNWFNAAFYEKVYRASRKAFEAELRIIDWIFEKGELDFMPKSTLLEFVKQRFNDSVELIGGKKVFEVDARAMAKLKWFEDEIYAEVSTDFFHKKPVTYSKKVQSIKAEDIF